MVLKKLAPMVAPIPFLKLYLDVLRLNQMKFTIDFLGFIVYNTVTRSVESDGHGHGNSPLAAVGDREAVGSRNSAQTLRQIATKFYKSGAFTGNE